MNKSQAFSSVYNPSKASDQKIKTLQANRFLHNKDLSLLMKLAEGLD